jgi:hypothetical protein
MTSVYRTSAVIAILSIALTSTLSGCSSVRKALGQVETAAAKNEQGQLISPSLAPSEVAPTEPALAQTETTSETTSVRRIAVNDIKRANLPGGLGGDTANQIYIGDAIVPK